MCKEMLYTFILGQACHYTCFINLTTFRICFALCTCKAKIRDLWYMQYETPRPIHRKETTERRKY